MSKLTCSIKLPIDSHNKKLATNNNNNKNKYSSCVVAGNNKILLDKTHGSTKKVFLLPL